MNVDVLQSLWRRRLKLDQDVFKLVDSVREQLSVSNNTKNGLTGNWWVIELQL